MTLNQPEKKVRFEKILCLCSTFVVGQKVAIIAFFFYFDFQSIELNEITEIVREAMYVDCIRSRGLLNVMYVCYIVIHLEPLFLWLLH